jgi:hypothetical protein
MRQRPGRRSWARGQGGDRGRYGRGRRSAARRRAWLPSARPSSASSAAAWTAVLRIAARSGRSTRGPGDRGPGDGLLRRRGAPGTPRGCAGCGSRSRAGAPRDPDFVRLRPVAGVLAAAAEGGETDLVADFAGLAPTWRAGLAAGLAADFAGLAPTWRAGLARPTVPGGRRVRLGSAGSDLDREVAGGGAAARVGPSAAGPSAGGAARLALRRWGRVRGSCPRRLEERLVVICRKLRPT